MDVRSEDAPDQKKLLRCAANGTALTETIPLAKHFNPLFKHPLPVSEHRASREAILRRVQCCSLKKQAAAAVTLGCAWTLEEVYMNGADVELANKNGFTPLHLAVQMNNFECIMALINMGVNVNATTISGVTPRFLAFAGGNKESETVLAECGALIEVDLVGEAPAIAMLEYAPKRKSLLVGIDKSKNLPSRHTLY